VSIRESCSICTTTFDVQFRYQMEEKEGGFSFFCSQKCLETSQKQSDTGAVCGACAKRFTLSLAAQILYVKGKRHYACGPECRVQIQSEAEGLRLGQVAAGASSVAPPPEAAPAASPTLLSSSPLGAAPKSVSPLRASLRAPSGEVVPLMQRQSARPAPTSTARGESGARLDGATPRVLAVFNHKGGTGKTTSAVSVAAGLALAGKRVLLVDTDAQGNVAVSLGATSERSLYHVLVMGLGIQQAVKSVRENLDLLPSNETLAAAELYLAGRQNRDRVLRERLHAATAHYDYVVIDCSPSLSLMNQNALVFADSVLVPVACDYLSLVGVRQVIKTIKNVNSLLHHPVQIWGVLPTFFDARAKICHEAVETLKEHFGDRCLAPVRAAIKVKEAPAQGQTIFEYAAGMSAAEDYMNVVKRLVASRERVMDAPQVAAAL
jgi:chromosome partitioning protein